MNRKILIAILLIAIIIAIGVIGYFTFIKKSAPYSSKKECEQKTGKQCYLFKGLCQVTEAQNQKEAEENEKFLKECLPKIGTWQPIETVSQSQKTQATTIEDRKLIDITFKVGAPFSTATLNIQENGTVAYFAKQQSQEEIQDSGTLTKAQISELAKFIEKIDFLDMKNRTKGPNDPEDGSTYTISLRILPEGADPALAYPGTHSVSCYQFSCEHNFLELKDKIIELWGKNILEVGV